MCHRAVHPMFLAIQEITGKRVRKRNRGMHAKILESAIYYDFKERRYATLHWRNKSNYTAWRTLIMTRCDDDISLCDVPREQCITMLKIIDWRILPCKISLSYLIYMATLYTISWFKTLIKYIVVNLGRIRIYFEKRDFSVPSSLRDLRIFPVMQISVYANLANFRTNILVFVKLSARKFPAANIRLPEFTIIVVQFFADFADPRTDSSSSVCISKILNFSAQ